MTLLSTFSSSGISEIMTTSPPSFTVTPAPTSRRPTDFVYVEYDDYDDYSSYEDPSIHSATPDIIPTTTTTTTTTTATTTTTTTTTTTRRARRTAPSHLFKRKTTTTPMPPATVPIAYTEGQGLTLMPVMTSAVPEFPTSPSVDPDEDFIATASPNRTSERGNLQTKINLIGTEPTPPVTSSSLFFPLPKKENNSVDEVPYRIVGLDSDITRGHQNYFVPRMPPFRERTQNKRIQQLLNEKRRQDLLKRSARSREGRTDRKHVGL